MGRGDAWLLINRFLCLSMCLFLCVWGKGLRGQTPGFSGPGEVQKRSESGGLQWAPWPWGVMWEVSGKA